jgi:hypothetical protein
MSQRKTSAREAALYAPGAKRSLNEYCATCGSKYAARSYGAGGQAAVRLRAAMLTLG